MLRLLALCLCVGPLTANAAGEPLVFIHGIKGSRLADAQGKTYWLTGLQALGLQTPDLRLLLAPEPDSPGELVAVEPLGRVAVVPGVFQEQIYGPWLAAAKKMGVPFHSFAYDWRRDPSKSVDRLEAFIEAVRVKHAAKKVRVVAHSMGGLITLALLNQRPELFSGVAFAGVPFAGGLGFLVDLHVGTSAGLNSKILSPEVLFTFPSVYVFFPLNGAGLIDSANRPIPMDFYSAAAWKEKRLGLFARGGVSLEQENFLARTLARAKSFRQRLAARRQAYPPVLVITNRSRPSLKEVVRDGPKSDHGWDFESAASGPGDGRVLEERSFPPSGIPYQTVYSEAEHSKLLNDPRVIAAIQEWLGR